MVEKTSPQLVEEFHGKSLGVRSGLHHERRHGGNQYGCGHALCAMASDVACNLASACGVTYKSDILEIQFFNHSCQIVGVGIHVISRRRLARAAVTTAVMRNCAEAI